jgi:hypothetical protein
MALFWHAAADHDTISTALDSVEYIQRVDATGARRFCKVDVFG